VAVSGSHCTIAVGAERFSSGEHVPEGSAWVRRTRWTDDLVKVAGVSGCWVASPVIDHCGTLWGRLMSSGGRLSADMIMNLSRQNANVVNASASTTFAFFLNILLYKAVNRHKIYDMVSFSKGKGCLIQVDICFLRIN
jgi:hypothetical protein